ncbi:hypothetical protein Dda_5846 [Drechslerella dactyloides]|uniref:DUF1754-domain-containing protein n=1 Tax=Drechslerella dactyloides TaxID=74499 RepID=A0AAD6IV20_DREDA|nr:hypothetical protein Dda_5846 [Drechslerella dactyloides]
MGRDDYSSSIGGSLRLKGSAGVSKPKKKKKSSKPKDDGKTDPESKQLETGTEGGDDAESSKAKVTEPPLPRYTKTEAERKFEEARKKKLDQVLLKEASKSHKEKVEEFNKYLSNLSEHHDMPRIGPG